jgi:hypothetical protein
MGRLRATNRYGIRPAKSSGVRAGGRSVTLVNIHIMQSIVVNCQALTLLFVRADGACSLAPSRTTAILAPVPGYDAALGRLPRPAQDGREGHSSQWDDRRSSKRSGGVPGGCVSARMLQDWRRCPLSGLAACFDAFSFIKGSYLCATIRRFEWLSRYLDESEG